MKRFLLVLALGFLTLFDASCGRKKFPKAEVFNVESSNERSPAYDPRVQRPVSPFHSLGHEEPQSEAFRWLLGEQSEPSSSFHSRSSVDGLGASRASSFQHSLGGFDRHDELESAVPWYQTFDWRVPASNVNERFYLMPEDIAHDAEQFYQDNPWLNR